MPLPKPQKLTENSNLQTHHSLSPGCKIPEQGGPHTSQPYDDSIKQEPHHRKGLVAMKLLELGNERRLGHISILQQPLKTRHHDA